MLKEIYVPPLGESVTEATVAKWLKKQGDIIKMDEPLVELETDKVTLEVNASQGGVLQQITQTQGSVVKINDVLGFIDSDVAASKPTVIIPQAPPVSAPVVTAPLDSKLAADPINKDDNRLKLSPAVRKMVSEAAIEPTAVTASGKDGRLLKADVQAHLDARHLTVDMSPVVPHQITNPIAVAPPRSAGDHAAKEQRVPMSRLRNRIAERLKDAQNTSALLTTFNEVDMTSVMAVRAQYRESFEKKHGVKLGFMSFFVKACVNALQDIPSVNAEIDGDDIIYKKYYDISVAISAPQGLVVPVVRDADSLSFAGIEKNIYELSVKARDNKLTIADLTGGTFTITNGGTFGSMMSTPIINPPQSGILGMHKIQERPVAINGKVEIRPMMYLALTYDHRLIDGREAVTFLVRVKECIENPERILLDI